MGEKKQNIVISRKDFINILYQNKIMNTSMEEHITRDDISNIIDDVSTANNNNEVECFEELLKAELIKKFSDVVKAIRILGNSYYNKTYFLKINDNKYIYLYLEQGKEEKFVKQIDFILKNNLVKENNKNYLIFLRNEYNQQLKFNEAMQNNLEKSIIDKFKDYDYIKIINENSYYNDIGVKDINECKEFISYHENVKHYLNIEQQILLRLIVLYGIRNIYINNFDYFKTEYNEIIDYAMKNIDDYISFIRDNINNIENKYLYSKSGEYRTNIIKSIAPIFINKEEWWKIPGYRFTDEYAQVQFVYLLKYIRFVYYVSDIKFESEEFKEAIKKFENVLSIKKLKEEKNMFNIHEFESDINIFEKEIEKFKNLIDLKDFEKEEYENMTNKMIKAKKLFDDNRLRESIKVFKEIIILFGIELKNKRFNEAKKIFEENLPLFSFFKEESDYSKHNEYILYKLLEDIHIEPLLLPKYNTITSYGIIDDIYIKPKIKNNIKILLRFYISCYYYFKHFRDEKNLNKIYEFLLFFKNGYGIEEYIMKFRYIKMAEKMCDLKTTNVDNVEDAVNLIDTKITEMQLVNKFDINDVVKSYPHINFEKLDERVKTYIATGDKIVTTFDNNNESVFDYSSAVIEWSKAVELEINNKFISNFSMKDKYDIQEYANKTNRGRDKKFILDIKNPTIGIFKAIKIYNLQDYLYEEYFSKLYTFSKNTYDELCQYVRDICEPRNDSAHKDKSISIVTATECKSKILKSNRILEILSKLESIN